MNKLTKGAIAGAAGIILLMGGAGTLAYWNDSADVLASGQSISSGDLTLGTSGSPSWTVKPWNGTESGTAIAIPDIGSFTMVPGDVVEYEKTVTLNAVGTTLKVELTLAPGSITSTGNALSAELADAASLSIAGALPDGITATATPGVYDVEPGSYTLPIAAVIDWADGGTGTAGSENAAKGLSVTFGEFAVQVKQVFN